MREGGREGGREGAYPEAYSLDSHVTRKLVGTAKESCHGNQHV